MNSDLLAEIQAASILVVDDLEPNVMLLEGLLRQRGFSNVDCTTQSAQVAALHAVNAYDLILLDLQMPPPNGIEVLEQLRKQAKSEDFLPVMVISASSDVDNRLKALRLGARDYILKPFEVPEVMQRIMNHLEVRMLYRERQRQSAILELRVRQ